MAAKNNTTAGVVDVIERQVERLIADHRRVTELNQELLEERASLLAVKKELQQQLKDVQRQYDKQVLLDGLEGATKSPKRATAYINRMVREVDSCMAALVSTPREE